MIEVSARGAPATPTPRRSILLVEDDDAVRRSLQLLLTAKGFQVRAYSSPVALARDPAALHCDCLVADLVVPPGNAVALLGDLRSAGWSGPAILISGLLDDDWREKALGVGFEAILPKPISEAMLVRTIEQLAQRP